MPYKISFIRVPSANLSVMVTFEAKGRGIRDIKNALVSVKTSVTAPSLTHWLYSNFLQHQSPGTCTYSKVRERIDVPSSSRIRSFDHWIFKKGGHAYDIHPRTFNAQIKCTKTLKWNNGTDLLVYWTHQAGRCEADRACFAAQLWIEVPEGKTSLVQHNHKMLYMYPIFGHISNTIETRRLSRRPRCNHSLTRVHLNTTITSTGSDHVFCTLS